MKPDRVSMITSYKNGMQDEGTCHVIDDLGMAGSEAFPTLLCRGSWEIKVASTGPADVRLRLSGGSSQGPEFLTGNLVM